MRRFDAANERCTFGRAARFEMKVLHVACLVSNFFAATHAPFIND